VADQPQLRARQARRHRQIKLRQAGLGAGGMGFRVGGKHEKVLYKKTVYMLLVLGIHQPSP
jgi:hypothetical protein